VPTSRVATPTAEQLHRLRALRVRAGLGLDEVADRTGLPVAHVEALEQARVDQLPAGPYLAAYYRLVLGVVGGPAEVDEVPEPPADPPRASALWVPRAAAFVAVLGLLGAMAWQVRERGLGGVQVVADALGPAAPRSHDLEVRLTARRDARLRVVADGEVALDGAVAPGASHAFRARDRIEVYVPAAEAVAIEYNGQPVVPQGRQGTPRKLVFVDDLAPGD
jgi:transcriptional regulator with XRE-family HTH domain